MSCIIHTLNWPAMCGTDREAIPHLVAMATSHYYIVAMVNIPTCVGQQPYMSDIKQPEWYNYGLTWKYCFITSIVP